MSLGLHETRQRRQRRFRWAVTKWVVTLGLILAAGVFAYRTGTGLAERKVTTLAREIVTLSDKAAALQQQNTGLRANEIVLEERLRDARTLYDRDVPAGRMAALLGQLKAKLEKGVELARLEFLIASADNPRECEEVPATKRFLVQTPLYKGANDSVSYDKGTITVTAQGESAVSATGQVEAWYDPAKPVTAHFTAIGGRVKGSSGTLPIHATVVHGRYEYRFTMIAANTRGFVIVTGDRCNYP